MGHDADGVKVRFVAEVFGGGNFHGDSSDAGFAFCVGNVGGTGVEHGVCVGALGKEFRELEGGFHEGVHVFSAGFEHSDAGWEVCLPCILEMSIYEVVKGIESFGASWRTWRAECVVDCLVFGPYYFFVIVCYRIVLRINVEFRCWYCANDVFDIVQSWIG